MTDLCSCGHPPQDHWLGTGRCAHCTACVEYKRMGNLLDTLDRGDCPTCFYEHKRLGCENRRGTFGVGCYSPKIPTAGEEGDLAELAGLRGELRAAEDQAQRGRECIAELTARIAELERERDWLAEMVGELQRWADTNITEYIPRLERELERKSNPDIRAREYAGCYWERWDKWQQRVTELEGERDEALGKLARIEKILVDNAILYPNAVSGVEGLADANRKLRHALAEYDTPQKPSGGE